MAYAYCIAGETIITMSDNTRKFAMNVKKGDKLMGDNTVVCVIEFAFPNGTSSVKIGDSEFSSYQPIFINDEWVYAKTLQNATAGRIYKGYNFVLDKGHIINAENMYCITLCHNMAYGILKDSYFGSKDFLPELENMATYDEGLIEMKIT